MTTDIDFNSLNVFKKFPSFIPWFDVNKGTYAVIVYPDISKGVVAEADAKVLKEKAIDALMEYYLPEFYPLISGPPVRRRPAATRPAKKAQSRSTKKAVGRGKSRTQSTVVRKRNPIPPGVKDSYTTIRKQISDNLDFIKTDQGPADLEIETPVVSKYLYNTRAGSVNFKRIREGLRTFDPAATSRQSASTPVVKSDEPCLLPGQKQAVVTFSSGMPPFADAEEFFINQYYDRPLRAPAQEIIISLGGSARTLRELKAALGGYNKQILQYPAPLKIPLDLETIYMEIHTLVATLTDAVRRNLNLSGKRSTLLTRDDLLRIQLGPDQNILGASYELELADGSLEISPLKVGFISLVKHNRSVKDPWMMQTLVNHQRIISDFRTSPGGLNGILGFIKDTYGSLLSKPTIEDVMENQPIKGEVSGDGVEIEFQAPPPPGVDPLLFNTVFQAAESSVTLDILNPMAMAATMSNFLNPGAIAAMEDTLNDPEVQASLFAKQAGDALSAKFPLKQLIDDVIAMINEAKGIGEAIEERQELERAVERLEGELNAAIQNGDPLVIEDAQRAFDRAEADLTRDRTSGREGGGVKQVQNTLEIMDDVLGRFGIPELIAEALICLTMGTNFSLDRIRAAMDSALELAGMIEDYEVPKIKDDLIKLPEFPEIKFPNPITGDPPLWKQIVDMLLEILMELAMDLVLGLVEMIKLNCNNLHDRPELLGNLDAAQAMKDNLSLPKVDVDPLLNNAFGQFQMNQEDGFDYLSAVSAVLTPMEICRLYNSRPDVLEETVEKIAIFNTTWSEPSIQRLQSRNQILSFFATLSPLANMTTICNDLVNDVDVRAAVENYCLNEADFAPLADQESIKKLADMLNNGIPIDPASLLPNLLCPEHPQFLANPIVDRIIPSMFNSTADNVKMQFIYSVENSRTAMLEPKIVAGGKGSNHALNTALKDLCVHGKVGDDCVEPEPPNSKFLSILSDIFEEISNFGADSIDPEICPDVNLDKLGGSMDAFQAMLPIINQIMEESFAAGSEARDALDEGVVKIEEVKKSMDDSNGMPPSVTYVFNRNFYNNFMAMGRQSAPEYVDTDGTDKPNSVWLTRTESRGGQRAFSSHMKKDRSNSEYGRMRMQYRFLDKVKPRINPINLDFYSNEDIMSGRPPFRVRVPEGLVPGVEATWLEGTVEDDSFTPLYGGNSNTSPEGILGDFGSESGFNPYIFNFTYPLQTQLLNLADAPLGAADKRYLQDKLQKQVFPTVLNGMIERSVSQIEKQGIFTLSKLNSLNLFKDNSNCDPAQAGDLLDTRGILEQLKQEFGEAACNEEGDARDCAKNALKMGLIYLFIQVYVVEFLIKNVFVLSAFKFEEIFQKPLLREMFLTSMITQIEEKLGRGAGGIERFLRDQFEKMLVRDKAVAAGGIAHSYSPDTVVSLLKTGADVGKDGVPFKVLVQYLIEERLGFTHEVCGQMVDTMQSINNILSPAGARSTYEDDFIKEILGVYKAPYGLSSAPQKSNNGRVFFAKYAYWDGISNWSSLASSQIIVPWNPRDLTKAQNAWDQASTSAQTGLGHAVAGGPLGLYATQELYYEATYGGRPDGTLPRHTLTLQDILGSAGPGAMPVKTGTAIDFIDLVELTDGTLPEFEGLKIGYKLIFNFPQSNQHHQTLKKEQREWDAAATSMETATAWTFAIANPLIPPTGIYATPETWYEATHGPRPTTPQNDFIDSFPAGPVRDLMTKAIGLQARSTGPDSILDSAQADLDTITPGPQILGDLLTVNIKSLGDFNPNELNVSSQPGESADTIFQKIKRFDRVSPSSHIPRIKEDPEYSRFISQTFNPEIIMMIPVLYSFGLTNTFFDEIEKSFDTTKVEILGLLAMIDRTDQAPPVQGLVASDNLESGLASNGESDMNASAREFILKMLRETPIKILKGFCEMLDPHVAIWKLVRQITGDVFGYVIDIIDTGIDIAVNAQPDDSPLKPMLKTLEGEQLLALAFCGLNTMNAEATAELPDPPGPLEAPSLGPKMSVTGVDFTGTIVGLFCMPPFIFGIIYLLLNLLDEGDAGAGSEGTENSQQNMADGQSSNVC